MSKHEQLAWLIVGMDARDLQLACKTMDAYRVNLGSVASECQRGPILAAALVSWANYVLASKRETKK